MAKVLLIGSGGREHALGWKLSQSEQVTEVHYAPGNGGTAGGKGRNIPIDGSKKENFDAIAAWIQKEEIGLTVVGPEAPLAEGIVDFLHEKGIHDVFGPIQAAARLEEDKFFSFDIMQELGIPQAEGIKCHNINEAITAIKEQSSKDGVVIKARGLTGGKGVKVCDSAQEAIDFLEEHKSRFGHEILISERMFGQEFSVFGICDGEDVLTLPVAFQDHKPVFDGDKGPNTGGMGAYGPAPIAPPEVIEEVHRRVMEPIVKAFAQRGTPYCGFLYAGMMMTETGPRVIEFNVRFGDPECQPAMMLLEDDLYDLLKKATAGTLKGHALRCRDGHACCVVLASKGYPGAVTKGLKIQGIEEADALDGVKVFHAGTCLESTELLTSGGRVLGVTSTGEGDFRSVQQQAYKAVACIDTEGGFHFRRDIGAKAHTL
ncbi:MAG: phosphoribosylamine--glycine ligase [Deltaproteobacteria bacterium]|nr:phosphoribosylamine--glycine ligase [Deltaproteobacteria bacterium]MBU50790.1 phosphoribosylamine--glycine ligase [Deltaproteobacteria bacterium]|tara:strand:+ start:10917 stop:12206 length:1290 start_codon:yes stop_codon:yes gene_type:complete